MPIGNFEIEMEVIDFNEQFVYTTTKFGDENKFSRSEYFSKLIPIKGLKCIAIVASFPRFIRFTNNFLQIEKIIEA